MADNLAARETPAFNIGTVPGDGLLERRQRIIAVDYQHEQGFVQRQDAQRVQIQPGIGDFVGVTLDCLRIRAVYMRKPADAQFLFA